MSEEIRKVSFVAPAALVESAESAADEIEQDPPVTLSAWIRQAMREKLERDV